MTFDDVYLVNDERQPLTDAEVDEALEFLDPLPPGYREYLTTLGSGEYCDFLYVWPPSTIRKSLSETRSHISQFFPYEFSKHPYPDRDYGACVPIANSIDGDYLVVWPDSPHELIGLPRQDFECYRLPLGFADLLNWELYVGQPRDYVFQPPFRFFEPSSVDFVWYVLRGTKQLTLAQVTHALANELAEEELRRIDDEEIVILYPRSIHGRIQIVEDMNHGVSVHIRGANKRREKTASIVAKLQHMGAQIINQSH